MDDVERERNAKLRELKALMQELERFFNSRGMLYWLDEETGELMYQDVNEPPAKPHEKHPQSRRMEKAWRMRHLGTIDAASGSAKEAIEEAFKKFNTEPARRNPSR